jgi:hypothetical protein
VASSYPERQRAAKQFEELLRQAGAQPISNHIWTNTTSDPVPATYSQLADTRDDLKRIERKLDTLIKVVSK